MGYNALRRVCELDTMIKNGALRSAQQAAEHFGVSRRTIERYIDQLKTNLNTSMRYNRKKKCYEYIDSSIPGLGLGLNERELAILLIAERALRVFTGTSFDNEVHPSFNKIIEPIRHDKQLMQRIRDLCKSVIFFNPFVESHDVHQQFSTILDAIMLTKRISMEYRPITNNTQPRRNFDPYVLISNANRWFVVGYCHNSKEVKAFALNMVFDPRIEKDSFIMPEEIKTQDYIDKFIK